MAWIHIFVYIALFAIGIFAADKSTTVGDITTKVRGQSGKILVYKGGNESDGVTIDFSAIAEISDAGESIRTHRYNNFAQLSFVFSKLENTTYLDTNVSVTKFNFTAEIPVDGATAKLTSEVFMFTEDGNITLDGNETPVKEGNMKFNVFLENWVFCDTCQEGNKQITGKYLDFEIEIKGKSKPEKQTDEGVYDLGDGATVLVPRQVIYDNNMTRNMPAGYPKLTEQGSRSIFTFRFEKFTESAFYDPTVDLGESSGDTTTTPAPTTETTIDQSDVEVKVLGKSGKITMMSAKTVSESKNSLTVEFDNLQEIDADGSIINDNAHKFNTFANQDFTFSPAMDANYPGTGLRTKKIEFSSTLTNGAMLKIFMYLFKDKGEITQNNETVNVEAGTLKFNVEVSNWMFCTLTSNCPKSAVGKYLDFEIVMKGSEKAKKDASKDKQMYDLGSGVVTLTKMIEVDDVTMMMESDYPMLVTKGSKEVFKFRFPMFTNKVLYDPTMALKESGGIAVRATYATVLMAIICMILQKYV